MKLGVLKNAPFDNPTTIKIVEGSKEWEEAYSNWIRGKAPTNSPEWRSGVFFGLEEKDK